MPIVLVRHAPTVLNEYGHYQGRCDPPLSPQGLRDAQLVARDFSRIPWVRMDSSPLQRARATCDALRRYATPTLPKRHDIADLAERRLGVIDGLCKRCAEQQQPGLTARLVNDLSYAPPDGESLAEVRGRAISALKILAETTPRGPIGVVTHGGVLRAILGAAEPEIPPLHAVVIEQPADGKVAVIAAGIALPHLPSCILGKG